MAKDTENKEIEEVKVEESQNNETSSSSSTQDTVTQDPQDPLSPYISFLNAMKTTKRAVSTAPTLTPKNFYDQIQFYESGGVQRLYIWINGTWRYVTLI